MILLQANNVARRFGDIVLFENVNFNVQTGDRIALVGRNGVGKSTLIGQIMGQEPISQGEITFARDITIGYLEQHVSIDSDRTIWEEMLAVFEDTLALREKSEKAAQRVAELSDQWDSAEYHKALEDYDTIQGLMADKNAYGVESEIRTVLHGFRFYEEDYDKPVRSLSGGQQTRLALARTLLMQYDLLILDEPTNHLDMETLTWLEGYLRGYRGALLIVSHDRYFLNRVANNVIELRLNTLHIYKGNYDYYLREKEARLEQEWRRYNKQQAEIAKLEDFVARNLARASTTKRAQSRRKKLEKMDRIEKPRGDSKAPRIQFSAARDSGDRVVELQGLAVGYPVGLANDVGEAGGAGAGAGTRTGGPDAGADRSAGIDASAGGASGASDTNTSSTDGAGVAASTNTTHPADANPSSTPSHITIAANINLDLRRQDAVAIVGPNGVGKSTLLKTILGRLEPIAGQIIMGSNVDLGYYDQNVNQLDGKLTVLETLWRAHDTTDEAQIRSILGSFLFSGETVEKKVSLLSGGEKARLSLALLASDHDNTLLLDEPTNHLDIDSKEVLEEALIDFDGTLLFVSHDRYFINRIATSVLEIAPDGATLYHGDYDYYLEKKAEMVAFAEADLAKNFETVSAGAADGPFFKEKTANEIGYEEGKVLKKELRRLVTACNQVEAQIEAWEARKEELQADLVVASEVNDQVTLQDLHKQLLECDADLVAAYDLWESTQLELEEFQEKYPEVEI